MEKFSYCSLWFWDKLNRLPHIQLLSLIVLQTLQESQGEKKEKAHVSTKRKYIFLREASLRRGKGTSTTKTVQNSFLWNIFVPVKWRKTAQPLPRKTCHFYPAAPVGSLFSSSLCTTSGLFCISPLSTLKLPFNAGPLHPLELFKYIYAGDSCLERSTFPSSGPLC